MRKEQKSFKDQLNGISIELFGMPLPKHSRHKHNDGIRLNKKVSTNTHVPGYESRKVCGITMATLPTNYHIDPVRLDAPCGECINAQCPYSMGVIRKFTEGEN